MSTKLCYFPTAIVFLFTPKTVNCPRIFLVNAFDCWKPRDESPWYMYIIITDYRHACELTIDQNYPEIHKPQLLTSGVGVMNFQCSW